MTERLRIQNSCCQFSLPFASQGQDPPTGSTIPTIPNFASKVGGSNILNPTFIETMADSNQQFNIFIFELKKFHFWTDLFWKGQTNSLQVIFGLVIGCAQPKATLIYKKPWLFFLSQVCEGKNCATKYLDLNFFHGRGFSWRYCITFCIKPPILKI